MEATTLSRKRIFHGKRWNAWHSVRHGARRQVAPHANFVDFGGNRQSPEAQRNGTTAHYHQKTHHLSVVSRRIARLKGKWGKSRQFCWTIPKLQNGWRGDPAPSWRADACRHWFRRTAAFPGTSTVVPVQAGTDLPAPRPARRGRSTCRGARTVGRRRRLWRRRRTPAPRTCAWTRA